MKSSKLAMLQDSLIYIYIKHVDGNLELWVLIASLKCYD